MAHSTHSSPPLAPNADLQTILTAWQSATCRLEQTHEALRSEVQRLTRELEAKNHELARQNRLADLGQMASHVAHLLNVIVTSPLGNEGESGGWYDRYGLENGSKCWGTFGQTYLAPNGARANIRFMTRDFLIHQNWVNGRKGFCAMAVPQP